MFNWCECFLNVFCSPQRLDETGIPKRLTCIELLYSYPLPDATRGCYTGWTKEGYVLVLRLFNN